MNPARAAANLRYHAALAAQRAAESGTDEQAFIAAKARCDDARRALVAAEIAHPTIRESGRRANLLHLRNRGVDV